MTTDLPNTFDFRVIKGQITVGSEYNNNRLAARKKKGGRGRIVFDLPESKKQRRFFEGGLVKLATYYQENLNYHDSVDCEIMRDTLIEQCLGVEIKEVLGVLQKKRKSSKGSEMLNKVCEHTIDYLVREFGLDRGHDVLNPDKYKYWRDKIYPYEGPDNYIDYLLGNGVLKPRM